MSDEGFSVALQNDGGGFRTGDIVHFGPGTTLRITHIVKQPDVNEPRDVCVNVVKQEKYDSGPFDFGGMERGSLDSVIKSLLKIRASIPPEFRRDAICDIDSVLSFEDSHYATIEVYYYRRETAEEISDRIQRDENFRRHAQVAQEESERAEYERLKAKFGA